MAREVNRGEVWRYRSASSDKIRPVLVLMRQEVIGLLHTVMVAPITSTIRGAPGEVSVGIREGLKRVSVVNLDHVQTVERVRLVGYVGHLGAEKMQLPGTRRGCRLRRSELNGPQNRCL